MEVKKEKKEEKAISPTLFLASAVTTSLAEDVDETALLNYAMFLDSSDIYEAFSLLAVGDVIAKQYLYDECKSIAHHLGF